MKKANVNTEATQKKDRNDEIIRIQKKRNNFAIIDKGFAEDNRLSLKGKGIMVYLLTKPDGWKVVVKDIYNHCKDGKNAIYSGLNELKKYGYYKKEPVRDEKGVILYWESVVYECPTDHAEEKDLKNAKETKTTSKKSEKSSISSLLLKNQEMDNQQMDNLYLDNGECNNINISNQSTLSNNVSINREKVETLNNQPISIKINNDMIDTNIIKTFSAEEVANKISLQKLKIKYEDRHEEIDMLYNIICEVLTDNPKPTFRVSKQNIPLIAIKPVFMELEKAHIEYVLRSLNTNDNKYKINKNAHNYLRTSLFHAPRTITHYHDRTFKKPAQPKDIYTEWFEKNIQRKWKNKNF